MCFSSYQMPWSWTNRQLWTPEMGSGHQTLGPCRSNICFLTTEPSLQSLKSYPFNLFLLSVVGCSSKETWCSFKYVLPCVLIIVLAWVWEHTAGSCFQFLQVNNPKNSWTYWSFLQLFQRWTVSISLVKYLKCQNYLPWTFTLSIVLGFGVLSYMTAVNAYF